MFIDFNLIAFFQQQAGHKYAELANTSPESVINRFFGIFFLFFHTCLVWGNLISSWGIYNIIL